jgi:hypothetical protein
MSRIVIAILIYRHKVTSAIDTIWTPEALLKQLTIEETGVTSSTRSEISTVWLRNIMVRAHLGKPDTPSGNEFN